MSRLCILVLTAWLVLLVDAAYSQPAKDPAPKLDLYGDPLPPGAITRFGTTRFRPYARGGVAFSPDGKMLALSHCDGTWRLWDTSTAAELRRVPTVLGLFGFPLAFSPDRRTLFAGGGDEPLSLWDPDTGEELARLPDHKGPLLDAMFSPDGKAVLVGSNSDVRCWDVATGGEVALLPQMGDGSRFLCFSSDGLFAASLGRNWLVRVWEIATGETRATIQLERYAPRATLSAGAKFFATQVEADAHLLVWDVSSGEQLWSGKGADNYIQPLSFSPNGSLLASTGSDATLRLWDATTGRVLWQHQQDLLTLHDWGHAAFTRDGKTMAYLDLDGIVHLLDVATGKERFPIAGHMYAVPYLILTPDGKKVITGADMTIRVWDAATGVSLLSRNLEEPIGSVALSADGGILVVSSMKRVHFLDVRTLQPTREVAVPRDQEHQIGCIALSPRANVLFASYYLPGNRGEPVTTFRWDWQSDRGPRVLAKAAVHPLRVSGDGHVLTVWHVDGSVSFWDAATGTVLREPIQCGHEISSPELSNDTRMLATIELDGLWVREVATGMPRYWVPAESHDLRSLAYSSDGRFLAIGRADGTIRVYHVATAKEIRRLSGQDGAITSLSFSRNGKTLLSGSRDCTALLWDISDLDKSILPPTKLTERQLHESWDRLGDEDAPSAFAWACVLSGSPKQTAAFTRQRPRPVTPDMVGRIPALLRSLDADDFETRDKAATELDALGDAAVPALRKALSASPSAEVRSQLRRHIAKYGDQLGATALREMRAIEILERFRDDESRAVLRALAEGVPEARRTREAKASLERLNLLVP
jgi:WD40 repeat protein